MRKPVESEREDLARAQHTTVHRVTFKQRRVVMGVLMRTGSDALVVIDTRMVTRSTELVKQCARCVHVHLSVPTLKKQELE